MCIINELIATAIAYGFDKEATSVGKKNATSHMLIYMRTMQ